MIKLLSKSRYFFIPFIFCWLIGFVFILFLSKGDAVLFFNESRSAPANLFFLLANMLAEWQFLLLLLAFMIWKSYGLTFVAIISFISGSFIVQFLKKFIFGYPRPASFFEGEIFLNFLEGMPIAYYNSFPSGHTTTAFIIFTALALFSYSKSFQLCCFFLALSSGVARIYLLQHFAMDVLAGATLGVLISTFIYLFVIKFNLFNFEKWNNKSLSSFIFK